MAETEEGTSRFIGFRMHPDNYAAFKQRCDEKGVKSVSAEIKRLIGIEMSSGDSNPDGAATEDRVTEHVVEAAAVDGSPIKAKKEAVAEERQLSEDQLNEVLTSIMGRIDRIEDALKASGISLPALTPEAEVRKAEVEEELEDNMEVRVEGDALSRVSGEKLKEQVKAPVAKDHQENGQDGSWPLNLFIGRKA